MTCGAATQINSEQILIFGGFIDSPHFKNISTFNRKIQLFNTKTKSFCISNKEIPIDYINSCNSEPIVCNEKIYSFGCFPQSISPKLIRCLDNDFILKFTREEVEVQGIINTGKSVQGISISEKNSKF